MDAMTVRSLNPASAFALVLATLSVLPALAAEADDDSSLPELPQSGGFRRGARAHGVDGVIHLSNGTAIGGKVSSTRGKRLELYDTTRKKWIRTDVRQIRTLAFAVEKETIEREWRWKMSGRDDKVYTGKTYVDRRYQATLTLKRAGKTYTGHVLGTVIYVTNAKGKRQRHFLRKDHRGKVGQKPGEIVYVRLVDLRPGAREAFRKEQMRREKAAKAKSKNPEPADAGSGRKPSAKAKPDGQ